MSRIVPSSRSVLRALAAGPRIGVRRSRSPVPPQSLLHRAVPLGHGEERFVLHISTCVDVGSGRDESIHDRYVVGSTRPAMDRSERRPSKRRSEMRRVSGFDGHAAGSASGRRVEACRHIDVRRGPALEQAAADLRPIDPSLRCCSRLTGADELGIDTDDLLQESPISASRAGEGRSLFRNRRDRWGMPLPRTGGVL